MILGLSVPHFTLLHVIISLIGIASGLVVLASMLKADKNKTWTAIFLVTTILTSVTGFFFHSASFGPPHVIGVISLMILTLSVAALYGRHLAGAWRWIYVVTALIALYLNVFVGVIQAFGKIPTLHAIAPTQSDPPFIVAQLVVMALFIVLGFKAVKHFRPAA